MVLGHAVPSKAPAELWLRVLPDLNEAQRRWLAGARAIESGWGGVKKMQQATGLSAPTIIKGMREVRGRKPLDSQAGIRRRGAGRRPVEAVDPKILKVLQELVDDATAGDPMGPLKWTHKSTRTLAGQLGRAGHSVAPNTVARLLEDLEYSLQVNAKSKEGRSPPERDAQFRYINKQVKAFQRAGNPVLSVDAKKKERVGDFKNPGKTYRKRGDARRVNVYDYPRLSVGKAIPYGAYDVGRNQGFVNVGVTHETAEFAVESLRWWWRRLGRRHYPEATGILVCADGGQSNGPRTRAWKFHLSSLSRELGIPITVCHYPPGTSKWNKIEHRMFSFISMNWQGIPLETYATVVNLIAGTKTKGGLRVSARLDSKMYAEGRKITDEEMAEVKARPHATHPVWNYTISP